MIPPHVINADWSRDVIKTLIALWNEGKSTREIAEALGKTRNASIGKIARLRAQGVQLRAGNNGAAMSSIRLGWRKREPKAPKTDVVEAPRGPSKPYLPAAVSEDADNDIVMAIQPKRLMEPLPVAKKVRKPVRQADDPREPLYWQRMEMIRAALRRQADRGRRHVA